MNLDGCPLIWQYSIASSMGIFIANYSMAVTSEEQINLRTIRQKITRLIEDGAVDARTIESLICGGIFVPKECELWDYKREVGKDKISLAEAILQIVSFYNTYGGYLVYGVEEVTDDREFIPVGITKGSLNVQQLKQQLINFTGDEEIDVTYAEVTYSIGDTDVLFGLLHVPKRRRDKSPVFFGKDSPQKKKGQFVFQKDSAYMRMQDQCIPVKTKEDYQLLFSGRGNPFLWDTDSPEFAREGRSIIVEHNLPDRSFICPKFVRRDQVIEDLWKWLADELAKAKVLAGDGGKGKTSIAYEFAEEVCRTKPYGVEKVIWLTAKTKQFIGELDEFRKVPQTNFYDLESLLKAICRELALLDEELEGTSIQMLKRLLKGALDKLSCLIIIDDVDSADRDQQRLILETAMQFPSSSARFLITTRMNLTYSNSMCMTVGGFEKDEYVGYVDMLIDRFSCARPKAKQIEHMHTVTEGSPLFTESLIRLYRMGMSIDNAIRQWQGKLGEEVRRAALQREVESLAVESRRILLACSFFGAASLTELKQATGYDDPRMQTCLNELRSLFLISTKPLIEKESRFSVSNNTANLVLQNKEMLVPDPRALQNVVGKIRKGHLRTIGKKFYLRPVGSAITQAIAFLRENKHDDAIATIESALNDHKNHSDLIFTKGRCLLEKYEFGNDGRCLDMARKEFSKAYSHGQRKESLFHLWYKGEMLARHPNGAVDVAKIALDNDTSSEGEWLEKRADAYVVMSESYERIIDYSSALDSMKKAAEDISTAIPLSNKFGKEPLYEKLFRVNDELWRLVRRSSEGMWVSIQSYGSHQLQALIELRNIAEFSIRLGDHRPVNFDHQFSAIDEACGNVSQLNKVSSKQIQMLKTMSNKSQKVISRVRHQLNKNEIRIYEERQIEIDRTITRLADTFIRPETAL